MYLHAGAQVIDIGFTQIIESQPVITVNNLRDFAQQVIPKLETQILVLNGELPGWSGKPRGSARGLSDIFTK